MMTTLPSPNTINAALSFLPLFEAGVFKESSSHYVVTGECPPHARDLLRSLAALGLTPEGFDWMSWIEQARPYLQHPESIALADADKVARLTAMAVQSDLFNKSLFPHLCSSGVLYHLLLRLRALYT